MILESFTAQGEYQSGCQREYAPDPQYLNVPVNIEYKYFARMLIYAYQNWFSFKISDLLKIDKKVELACNRKSLKCIDHIGDHDINFFSGIFCYASWLSSKNVALEFGCTTYHYVGKWFSIK